MRILQVMQKPQRRGAEVFANQLSQMLRHLGHQVYCAYLYPYEGAGALPLTKEDYSFRGAEQHPFEKVPGVHPQLLSHLLRLINHVQPDIVQVNGARTVKYGAIAHLGRSQQNWRLIYRNIGNPQDWMQGLHYRWFYKYIVMPQLDGIVGVSQTTLDNLMQFHDFKIPTKNIPCGVGPTLLQPTIPGYEVRATLQTPLDANVLLYVGSLSPEKRLDRLLKIFRQVNSQCENAYLWIVGDGSLRNQLQESVHISGLDPWVRFAGIQTDVGKYMRAADLFVLTSDTEGLPSVILEAGIVGIPSVATRVGGVAESILDGETGLLVDPQDEAGLTTAIVEMLRNPDYRLAMGRKAKVWVNDNFAMNHIAQKFLEFYKDVIVHKQ